MLEEKVIMGYKGVKYKFNDVNKNEKEVKDNNIDNENDIDR